MRFLVRRGCMLGLVLTLFVVTSTVSYRILCVFPVPSRSHGIMAKGIVDPLLEAGHQVTWVTPFSDWKPKENLTLITLPENVALAKEVRMSERSEEGMGFILDFGKNISTLTIENERVRDVLVNQQFDAVITEWFMTESDAGYAAIQQAPWILLNGIAMHPHMEFLMDEVRSVSTIPLFLNDGPVPMTFWERLVNTATITWMFFWALPESVAVADRYYAFFEPLAAARGVPLPPFLAAVYNISVLFVNSHPSVTPAQTMPPNVVEIGGYHIPEVVEPLAEDLQELLDGSPQGVVYFSMGSVFKASAMPASTARALANMLGELPHTVLWKYEAPLADLPANVHIRPWLPQASILAHRNTVLFITHGGLLSMLEAVQRGVPLLAMPVFGDQPANAARAARLGMARRVPYSPDVVPQLTVELKEMLGNRSYYERAQQLSRWFNARPVPPRRLLTHYVQLAIESKGAFHLRPMSHHYSWWARWMFDQLLVVYLVLKAVRSLATLGMKCLKAMCTKLIKGRSTKQKES